MQLLNDDCTGNKPVRTSKWTGTLGLSKTFTFSFEIAGDFFCNSGFYYNGQNTVYRSDRQVPASYLSDPRGLRLAAAGRNLENTRYTDGAFENDFGTLSHRAANLDCGVELGVLSRAYTD